MNNTSPQPDKAAISGRPKSNEWPIFISYRRSDATRKIALDLKKRLEASTIEATTGQIFALDVFVDVAEAHQCDFQANLEPHLKHSRALIVLADNGAAARKVDGAVDYLYEELDWWATERTKTPPIILQLDEKAGLSLVGDSKFTRWRKVSFMDCCWEKWSQNGETGEAEKQQLLGWLRESIRNYGLVRHLEEVRRLKRRALIAALFGAAALIAAGLGWWQRNVAVSKEALAIKNGIEAKTNATRADEEARKAIQNEREAKGALSRSDLFRGVELVASGKSEHALAYLARAVRIDPTNYAASSRLASLLMERDWIVPIVQIDNVEELSADGERVLSFAGNKALVYDALTGKVVRELPGAGSGGFASPDMNRIFTFTNGKDAAGGVLEWDILSGETHTVPLQLPTYRLLDHTYLKPKFSADGRFLVSIEDKSNGGQCFKVWGTEKWLPAANGKFDKVISSDLNSSTFSSDGSHLLVRSSRDVHIWNTQTGEQIFGVQTGDSFSYSQDVAFSPDEKRIAVGSSGQIFDITKKRPPIVFGPGSCVAFSPDGTRVVAGDDSGSVRIWDSRDGSSLPALRESVKEESKTDCIFSTTFSKDGRLIATIGTLGRIRLWDALSNAPLAQHATHQYLEYSARYGGTRYSLALTRDADYLITQGNDYVRSWDIRSRKPLVDARRLDRLSVRTEILTPFSPDGSRFYTADGEKVQIWEANSSRLPKTIKHGGVAMAKFSADALQIVTCDDEGGVRFWNVETEQQIGKTLEYPRPITNAAQFTAGLNLVVFEAGNDAVVLDAATGQESGERIPHNSPVTSAKFSADGRSIVTESGDGMRIFDTETRRPRGQTIPIPLYGSMHLSADHQTILVQGSPAEDKPGELRLFDAASGLPLSDWIRGAFNRGKVSSDNKRIVSISDEGNTRLFDTSTGRAVTEPLGRCSFAAFSQDGRRLALVEGKVVSIWDARTGLSLSDPLVHPEEIESVDFAPGEKLLTVTKNAMVRLWDVPCFDAAEFNVEMQCLCDLAEAIGGYRLSTEGVIEPLSFRDSIAVRTSVMPRLKREGHVSATSLHRYLEWLLGQPGLRSTSPFSEVSFEDWVQRRISEMNLDDLQAAVMISPRNPHLLAWTGLCWAKQIDSDSQNREAPKNVKASFLADFYSRRAVELAPADGECLRLRAQTLDWLK